MVELFDFLNDINGDKVNLMRNSDSPLREVERVYNPFVINRMLSYHPDAIMEVNEINMRGLPEHRLGNIHQYEFLLSMLCKRKRFTRLHKKSKTTEAVDAIRTLYGYSIRRAEEALSLLSDQQIEELVVLCDTGGKVTTKKSSCQTTKKKNKKEKA